MISILLGNVGWIRFATKKEKLYLTVVLKFLSTSLHVVNIALAEFNSIFGFPTCGIKHKPSSTYWPKDFLEAVTNEWTASHCNSTFFLHLRLCIGFKHQLFFLSRWVQWKNQLPGPRLFMGYARPTTMGCIKVKHFVYEQKTDACY